MSTLRLPLTLACLLAALGCRRADAGEPTHTPEPEPTAAATPLDDDDARACRAPTRFADYAWVPDDARLTTSIQRHDPELAAALVLLADRSGDVHVQLPVFAALDFRNLSLQLGTLDRLLAELALDPAELVELQSPRGELVWTWSTDCPPPVLAARALDRFGVQLRADIGRPGLRRGTGSPERFPFDLLTLGEHRVALTLVGQSERVGAWLHDAEHGSEDGPGERLTNTPPASIRAVLHGVALLDDPDATPAAARARSIRVTASEWTTDESP